VKGYQLQYLVCVLAIALGFISAVCLGSYWYQRKKALRQRHLVKGTLGNTSLLDALSLDIECHGTARRVIAFAVRMSRDHTQCSRMLRLLFLPRSSNTTLMVAQAGLQEVITPEGCAYTRAYLVGLGGLVGAGVGCIFSSMLMAIGALCGGAWGATALRRVLKEETQSRLFVAEKQLSQMIEIVVLGLKSGMTFDKALSLFHMNFSGSLSRSLAVAQGQWSHGLIERGAGLRQVAASYASPLFDRLAENIIRSLRFGTSLAGNLSTLSVEARAIRKSKLEEKVAKAPIKMLLPVGGLILPAMLMLILGPILLDLMQGF